MDTTKVFSKLLAAYLDPKIRIIALRGGTRSGKTWAAVQLLDVIGRKSGKKRVMSVVSETMPHLKRGVIRDFQNMLENENVWAPGRWHDTDKVYSYDRAKLEFFSADEPKKVHGPARDILYMNECINNEYETFRQLAIRTTEKIILDYNPAWEFWLDTKLAPHRSDMVIIDSTYLDNDLLTASQISEIESNREVDPEWWKVYGEGKTGSVEGLIWKNWDIVPTMPKTFKKEWIGIDWGWTNPTAVVHIGLGERGEVWHDELLYARGKDNPDIAQVIKDAGLTHLEAICDSAEPKSISELKGLGIPNAKPTDSKEVDLGIRIVNRYKKHYTARSLGLIDEIRKYRYAKDKKTDEYTNDVVKKFDHGRDAERYVYLSRLSNVPSGFDVTVGHAGRKSA
jgi:phage terminase large subunit